MLTSKGKHRVKVGNHPHKSMMSKKIHEKGKVQMQNIGNTFEINRSAT